MRTSCFLSLPPPTSNAKPPPPQLISSAKNEACWKRQCVVMGVASLIGLELCNSPTLQAHEITTTVPIGAAKYWSQKRTCPPWQGSSLETIVPENLPRPSAHRRYEAVRSSSKTAPSLSAPIIIHSNKAGCFSM